MSKIIKNSAGLYFVYGTGFGGNLDSASRLTEAEAADVIQSASDMGITNLKVYTAPEDEAPATCVCAGITSWAVCYVRKDDLNTDGSIKTNSKNPSRRRFATREEAIAHGSRFSHRKASAGDTPGSAGHVGFWIVGTSDPVNATVNPLTGLTNPVAHDAGWDEAAG